MSELKKGVINYVKNLQKLQTAQTEGFHGEVTDNVERYQGYGLTTIPMPVDNATGHGAEVIIAELNSNDLSVIVATDDRRYRPHQGALGDVMLYSTHDTPSAVADNATQRFILTDDESSIYRALLKINNCKLEMKSDGAITILNGLGCSITMSGTTISVTNGQVTMTLNGNQLSVSAGNVSINASNTTISGGTVNIGSTVNLSGTINLSGSVNM